MKPEDDGARAGISRAILLLAVLVVALCVAIAMPWVGQMAQQGTAVGCTAALDSASRRIAEDYMAGMTDPTPEQVKAVADRAMMGWDEMCPGGGDIYVVRTGGKPPFRLVCGLHDEDKALCTRLNAENVRDQVQARLEELKANGEDPPQELKVKLAHRDLTVKRVTETIRLNWGTDAMPDYSGVVAFYMEEDGRLTWLAYADELHAATWDSQHDWSGDSYDRLV